MIQCHMYDFVLLTIYFLQLQAEDEQRATKSFFNLFRAFHAEACLLTTVPTNSWIDQLGGMIAELIQTAGKEVCVTETVSNLFFIDY